MQSLPVFPTGKPVAAARLHHGHMGQGTLTPVPPQLTPFSRTRVGIILDRASLASPSKRAEKGLQVVPPLSQGYGDVPQRGRAKKSDRLDLEVQGDKAKNQRLKILHEIVENSQAFRVRRVGHVVDRANLGSLRWLAAGQAMRKDCGAQYTSKEIWSLPTRISNSCLPSLFLVGHFASSSLRAISLDTPTLLGLTTILQYLAVLHNALDLVDNQRAHEH